MHKVNEVKPRVPNVKCSCVVTESVKYWFTAVVEHTERKSGEQQALNSSDSEELASTVRVR